MDRRYCRSACRTLAYRMRLRTRGVERGPTAVPRWAVGRLQELGVALTTLGRVQGNVTVLARQMECEEASVRACLLSLRELGNLIPDVPPKEPEVRLRTEAERLREDLDESLAQRNKLDEALRTYKTETATEIAKLKKELESAKQTFLSANTQHRDDQAEVSRLQSELVTAKDQLQAREEALKAAQQDQTLLRDGNARIEKELLALREVAKKPAQPLPQRPSLPESAPHPQTPASAETRPTISQRASNSGNEAWARVDEQVLHIGHVVSLACLKQARAAGQGERVELWLSQHSTKIYEAGQLLVRVTLTARMEQDDATTIAKAAQEAYRQALDRAQSRASAFLSWFQQSKDFLMMLATAIVAALDARTSIDAAPGGNLPSLGMAGPTLPKVRTPLALPAPTADRLRDLPPTATPIPMEPQMPRIPRVDPLISLMKDKVELLHMLAEYQEERMVAVTGQLLEPYNETTVLAAARQAAREARREYYFRPHGLVAFLDLAWVIEGELLDPRSEDVLFGEVMDQIDRLKEAVAKVKPKPKPW